MKKHRFTSSDYDLLKTLLTVTKTIKLIYDDLYKLEINDKKDTDEYKSLMDALKYHIHREDELYQEIALSIERLYAFSEYLFPHGNGEFEDEVEMLKRDKIDEIIKVRLSSRLLDLINNYSFNDLDPSEEDLDDIENIDPELMADISREDIDYDKEYQEDVALEASIVKDISNTILAILNKYLKNPKYSFMKDKLVKFKYNYSYIYKSIEYSILENNLEISQVLYWENPLLSDLQRRDRKHTLSVLNKYIEILFETQVDDLTYLMTEEITIETKKEQLTLTAIILRASMLFADSKTIVNLRKTIDLEILLSGVNDPLIEETINEIFVENIKDNKLPHVISLNPML